MDAVDDAAAAFERAALGLGAWSDGMVRLTEAAGGHVGHLAGVDSHGALLIHNVWGVTAEQDADYMASGGPDPAINPRTRSIIAAPVGRILVDEQILSAEARRLHPFYNGFFRRNDVPHAAMMKLAQSSNCLIGLTVMRSRRAGTIAGETVQRLTLAGPRLAMMVKTGLLMQERQLSLCTTAIDAAACAVFVLNHDSCILDMSETAEALLRSAAYFHHAAGRIWPRATKLAPAFDAALAATRRDRGRPASGSTLMLPASTTIDPPLTVDFVPLPPEAGDWLRPGCCLLIARPPASRSPTTGLEALGLTASELQVAALLLEGEDVRTISARRGVAIGTTRNQIKAILAKSGRTRQIDFVRAFAERCRP